MRWGTSPRARRTRRGRRRATMGVADRSAESFDDLFLALDEYAEVLNRKTVPWGFFGPYFEPFSGGLAWPDEMPWPPWRRRYGLMDAMRGLRAYRTSLILGEPRAELEPLWRHGMEKFPRWVGFRESRRRPSKRLLRIHREGD